MRVESLKLLEKVMATNRKVLETTPIPEIIHEGAILIWNIGFPFLNSEHRQHVQQSFVAAESLLETIKSNNYQLRVNLLIEIAKNNILNHNTPLAAKNTLKALKLDYSIQSFRC